MSTVRRAVSNPGGLHKIFICRSENCSRIIAHSVSCQTSETSTPRLAAENWPEASTCGLRFLQRKEETACVLCNEIGVERAGEIGEDEAIANEAVERIVVIGKEGGKVCASMPAIDIYCTHGWASAAISLDFVKTEPCVNVLLSVLR